MRPLVVVPVAALALLVTGCSASDPVNEDAPGREISKSVFGDQWPLTVDSGRLRCEGPQYHGAVTFEHEGKVYALNGPATVGKLGRSVSPIWADDPTAPGTKKALGPLVAEGLKFCRGTASSTQDTTAPPAE
ncbi:MAG: DUF2511 domain-containing protein [Actinomycetales bacterium]|nr:DUF2511 domain-containing protein [Actinomycetales bacterium]